MRCCFACSGSNGRAVVCQASQPSCNGSLSR
jgi:hypothetical protein